MKNKLVPCRNESIVSLQKVTRWYIFDVGHVAKYFDHVVDVMKYYEKYYENFEQFDGRYTAIGVEYLDGDCYMCQDWWKVVKNEEE